MCSLIVCMSLFVYYFFPSNVNSIVYTLVDVHIFDYLVNKLEIWTQASELCDLPQPIKNINSNAIILIKYRIYSKQLQTL